MRVWIILLLLFTPLAHAKGNDMYTQVMCERAGGNICNEINDIQDVHVQASKEKHFGYKITQSSARIDIYYNGLYLTETRDYMGNTTYEGVQYDFHF